MRHDHHPALQQRHGLDPMGCWECLAMGGTWLRLQRCVTCGHVGCCDDSPQQHSKQHFAQTGHVLMEWLEQAGELMLQGERSLVQGR